MKKLGMPLMIAFVTATAVLAITVAVEQQEIQEEVQTVVYAQATQQPAQVEQQKPFRPTEHVIHLPEDGNQWYTTVVTSANYQSNPREREFLTWFSTEPRLASLRAQTKWTHYKTTDRLYHSRYAMYTAPSEAPAIVVQMPDGRQCFKANIQTMPDSPQELADAIQQKIYDCRPFTPKPPPVVPSPSPLTPMPPMQPTPPDLGPMPERPAKTDNNAFALAGGAFIAALLISLLVQFKKRVAV